MREIGAILIILLISTFLTSLADAKTVKGVYEYRNVQYIIKVNNKGVRSWWSVDGQTRIANKKNFKRKIDNAIDTATNKINNGDRLTDKQLYIYNQHNNVINNNNVINPGNNNNNVIIPPYIKRKDGIDKVIMNIENLIKDHGNLYIQVPVKETIIIQYKSEYGDEYVGIKWVVQF